MRASHAGEVSKVPLTPAAYRRITLAALVLLGVIVVSGAAVRLTDSGLGCSTWPQCDPGSLVPRDATSGHAIIEFGNRLFTFAVGASVVLAVLGSMVRIPRRADLAALSWVLVTGVGVQAVVGGISVRVNLAPPVVMAHFLLSSVLLVFATVLFHRAGEPDVPAGDAPPGFAIRARSRATTTPRVAALTKVIAVAAGIVLISGTAVTGTGPHGGDENAARLSFDVPDVTRVHSAAVWILVAATVVAMYLAYREGAPDNLRRALGLLVISEVAQGAIGYWQYAAGVPEGLVAVHIVGSVLVWIAAISVLLRTKTVEVEEAPPPSLERGVAATPAPTPAVGDAVTAQS